MQSGIRILEHCDVLIVGSGAAALSAALGFGKDPDCRIRIVTKTDAAGSGSTLLAQGGIAAARGREDVEDHIRDTLSAGSGEGNPVSVRELIEGSLDTPEFLERTGIELDRDADGQPVFNLEAAHSRARIFRSRGDGIGQALSKALIASIPRIPISTRTFVWSLDADENGIKGALLLEADGSFSYQGCSIVVIATGGAGQLYRSTTNPAESTGDGILLAHEVGIEPEQLAYVQFHPTALGVREPGSEKLSLLSEALRGAGARLVHADGSNLSDRDDDLETRDKTARMVYRSIRDGNPVFLDCSPIPNVRSAFPGLAGRCDRLGLDPEHDLLPVVPAAHYSMGGIPAKPNGETSVPGLYAVGEAAMTGVHGANRLASNSLLECIVFGTKTAEAGLALLARTKKDTKEPLALDFGRPVAPDSMAAIGLIAGVREAMETGMGIVRTREGMIECMERLDALEHAFHVTWKPFKPGRMEADVALLRKSREAAALLTAARFATAEAIALPASAGAHWVEDSDHIRALA